MTSCIACCSAVVIASSFKLGIHAILTRHEGTQISSAGKIVYSLDRWHFVRSDSLPKLCDCEAPFDSLEEPIDWLRKCLGFRENTRSKKDCSDGSPSRQLFTFWLVKLDHFGNIFGFLLNFAAGSHLASISALRMPFGQQTSIFTSSQAPLMLPVGRDSLGNFY